MNWHDIPWNPDPTVLRQFSGLWVVFVGFLAWRWGFPADPTLINTTLAVAAGVVGAMGLAWPRTVRWLFVGLTVVTLPIGWVVANTLLALVYFGLVTPMAVGFRLAGRDGLRLKRHPEARSYWVARPTTIDSARYFQQF